jgi:hypothetical protein
MELIIFITIIVSVCIFSIKSFHGYLHRKKINNELHKKIDSLIDFIDVIQSNIPKKENDLINENIKILESNLLSNDEKKETIENNTDNK